MRAPAFQWYPADFLADANVIAMNMAARGVYITLLSICWREEGLPSDPSKLARLCGMAPADFQPVWEMVSSCFSVDPRNPSRLIQLRLEKELKKQKKWRTKCAEGGRKSGATRRHKNGAADNPPADKDKAPKGSSTVVEEDVKDRATLQSSSSSSSSEKETTLHAANAAEVAEEDFAGEAPAPSASDAPKPPPPPNGNVGRADPVFLAVCEACRLNAFECSKPKAKEVWEVVDWLKKKYPKADEERLAGVLREFGEWHYNVRWKNKRPEPRWITDRWEEFAQYRKANKAA